MRPNRLSRSLSALSVVLVAIFVMYPIAQGSHQSGSFTGCLTTSGKSKGKVNRIAAGDAPLSACANNQVPYHVSSGPEFNEKVFNSNRIVLDDPTALDGTGVTQNLISTGDVTVTLLDCRDADSMTNNDQAFIQVSIPSGGSMSGIDSEGNTYGDPNSGTQFPFGLVSTPAVGNANILRSGHFTIVTNGNAVYSLSVSLELNDLTGMTPHDCVGGAIMTGG